MGELLTTELFTCELVGELCNRPFKVAHAIGVHIPSDVMSDAGVRVHCESVRVRQEGPMRVGARVHGEGMRVSLTAGRAREGALGGHGSEPTQGRGCVAYLLRDAVALEQELPTVEDSRISRGQFHER